MMVEQTGRKGNRRQRSLPSAVGSAKPKFPGNLQAPAASGQVAGTDVSWPSAAALERYNTARLTATAVREPLD
jgi:hypothetical protein